MADALAASDGIISLKVVRMTVSKVKVFSLVRYVEAALQQAEYERDENGVVVASVSALQGSFAQGETHEEARSNLEDVIEGNILLALQLGWDVPALPGVDISEQDVETHTASG